MSVITNNLLLGDEGYFLTKSLRFRSSASAYLNRTPASAGNQQKWTWSGWVKRGAINGTFQRLFSAKDSSNDDADAIRFNSSETFSFLFRTTPNLSFTGNLTTTQVFRDASAWYHVVAVLDTTDATSSNRMKLYINGSQVTAFSTATYPAQNANGYINSTNLHTIGNNAASLAQNLDGYLAEVNFIDGQALTPSSFGQTSATTGVWIPKKYTGTYGTNGFYLKFTDNSSLSALGTDSSGNGNTWTVNNFSVTSTSSAYDSMKDVPTLTDTDTANYAVWNPLTNGTATVTNGNLTSTGAASTGNLSSILIPTSGKWYAEFTWSGSGAGTPDIGIFSADVAITSSSARCEYRSDGSKVVDATVTGGYGATYTNGDVISVAVDVDSNTVTFYKNNASQGAITYTSSNGRYGFNVIAPNSSWILNANFGQRPFAYTPPTGFKALNTFNLPTPTIGATASTQANKYFNVVSYSGNSPSSQTISVGFQPDFVWQKSRGQAYNHTLYDAVRGATKELYSNTTGAETTDSNGLTAFTSDGFTVGSDGELNDPTAAHVAWNWKANGSGSTNTAGSITSTVSANTSAGFSIVTWTGNGTGGATIGHGLGIAPSMVIVKKRSGVADWPVQHISLGPNASLRLNGTDATANEPWWNSTAPSSTLVTLGSSNTINQSSETFVAYCFAEVAGYSKAFSYTGNGSSDGTFVYTGFRPKFIIYKRTDSSGSWVLIDSARGTYNVINPYLLAESSGAEDSANIILDFLSNGFKQRNTFGASNGSGGTYIGFAFSEHPFKYSLAR